MSQVNNHNNINMKKIKITKEEENVLNQIEHGVFTSTKSLQKDIKYYAQIAKDTTSKNKLISLRISGLDLLKLKARALQEGIPYQTLITSSIHKLTNSRA
jgi:predicted DNA binding CopG/RHH family protein